MESTDYSVLLPFSDLTPIPEQTEPEVYGSVEINADGDFINARVLRTDSRKNIPFGTYDLVRREP